MARKKAATDSKEEPELTLEEAMAELSSIVSQLESGQQSLDDSLAQFEHGMSLLRVCHNKLDATARRIEVVTRITPDGDVETADFESTSTLQKSNTAARATRKPQADEGDDALLF